MDYRYLEDIRVGETLETHSITVTEAEIIAFARQFDPQPIHVDPAAATAITGGLIASGWHTAAMTMGLFVTGQKVPLPPGTLGAGVDRLKWLQPVRPGDQLHLRVEVTAIRVSASKPDRGIVTSRFTTMNQDGDPVQEMVSSAIVPRRPPSEAKST